MDQAGEAAGRAASMRLVRNWTGASAPGRGKCTRPTARGPNSWNCTRPCAGKGPACGVRCPGPCRKAVGPADALRGTITLPGEDLLPVTKRELLKVGPSGPSAGTRAQGGAAGRGAPPCPGRTGRRATCADRLDTAPGGGLNAVRNDWKEHATVLLHGVTASGKTVYMRLMLEALERV